MNKQFKYSNAGMNQDISNAKFDNKFYFEGMNIRVLSTDKQSSGAITNTKGNEFLLTIPIPNIDKINKIINYNDKQLSYTNSEIDFLNNSNLPQQIIANCKIKDGFIIFSTNNNGLDCIWQLTDETFDLKLLYLRNLNFSTEKPIQILNNYENNKIDKIYWVDGYEQMRFINIHHSIDNEDLEELIDLSSVSINIVSDVNFSNINIDEINYGGTHTSGMIQYAYSYYKINGSESALSPLSNIIPLGKSNDQGGNLNEIIGTIPKIVIDNIDQRFTNLKLYAIKYTSLNQIPKVSVIADRNITGLNTFTYYDNGRILYDSSLENILFLYGKMIIPKHIESKNNRLFAFNYKDRVYKLSLKDNNLDTRAYSFPINSSNVKIYKNITDYDENTNTVIGSYDNINYINNITNPNFLPFNHSSINGNYNINKYLPNSNVLGGEGYYLKYELIRTTQNSNNIYDYRFFKDGELYRIAIQFYNKYGLKSTPNWIADFVVTSDNPQIHNLSKFYAGIKITLKPEFYVWLNTSSNFLNDDGIYDEFLKPVGFKLLRGERTNNDKSIINQGIVNGMISISDAIGFEDSNSQVYDRANKGIKMPSLMRRFDNYLCPMYKNLTYDRLDNARWGQHPQWKSGTDVDGSVEAYTGIAGSGNSGDRSSLYQFNQLMQLYSPETLFELNDNVEVNKVKVVGGIYNDFNYSKSRIENWQDAIFNSFQNINNALSSYDIKANTGAGDLMRRGIFGPDINRSSSDRKEVGTYQFFRQYTGTFYKNLNNTVYDVYGKPELTALNQNVKKYNNDNDLKYVNNFSVFKGDTRDSSGEDNTSIDELVSQGAKCITFALGNENDLTENRPTIEKLFNNSSITGLISNSPVNINSTAPLDIVVAKYTDLLSLSFTNKYVGVLENNNVYFNNDITTVVNIFNSENVNLIFDSISSYDTEASATIDDWTGLKVAIVDGTANKIYIINDQTTSLAGLTDTIQTFDYLNPLPFGSINKYLFTLTDFYNLNTSVLPNNYTVGIIENNTKYRWKIVSHTWEDLGTFTIPVIDEEFKGGVGLIVELIKEEKLKYIGNYYGGNSYEAKTKTVYVEASKYFKIDNTIPNYIINDPGDVFVQEYSLLRISKTEVLPSTSAFKRISEIIKVRLESTVNQNKRNDESNQDIEGIWQPSQGDYHVYNRVYSQQSNLLKSQDFSYEVKQNELYDASIIASSQKIPGEIIDNFTNFQINNTMHLEGKYGSINAVIKHNDEILTFQDNAIAQISINPRVQIQGNDGISIKLGTGDLLDKYTYINTNTGTLNKWGVISTNSGIYYYDTINNSLNTISQNGKLSDLKQLHSFFQKNINNDIIRKNNHILKEGIQFGYDYLNNDIYFTFLQSNNSITINFNELQNEFVSLHSFKPSFYFNKGEIFITSDPSNNKLYNHLEGIYNTYYDEYNPSYVIYNLNPEPDVECVFDNINFKSEAYINNIDQPLTTINGIQCYNDYQDSTLIPLIEGRNSNLRRKFRDWNAIIPREGRNRIRGPYSKLKLQFDNDNNCKLILHDIVLSYTM